jgi:hypothetical protein
MAAWRTLGTLVVALVMVRTGWAQTYPLSESLQAGDCFRIHLDMTLSGAMRVNKEGRAVSLKLEATATHEFPERILNVASDGLPEKTARVYEKAKAVISVDKDPSERALRTERRLFVAQRSKDRLVLYSPASPLTREELELISEHFDTLALPGLLPGRAVSMGETWKVPNAIVQALCNFEGLTEQDLVCKLEEVKDQVARVSVKGSATGIDLGALTKLSIDATYQYRLDSKRLTRLEWKQKDERDQGPASPATSVQTTIALTRTAVEQPAALSDVALVSVPETTEPPMPLTQLEYRDAKGRFDMLYGREWQTVGQGSDHVVMRLLDRGDFVAQVTITPWTKAEKGKHLTPDEFRKAMAETPGWEPEDELQAGEVPADGARWVYRISTLGELDGTKVMQNFYLVAGPDGQQVVLAFTMPPKQADRLGTRDLSMAANIDFPGSRQHTEKLKQP